MIEIRCPACGDDDPELDDAAPQTAGAIRLRCTKCARSWERQPRIVCGKCGSSDVAVSGYAGSSHDNADESHDSPATARSHLDREVLNCRKCRHRWSRVEAVRPYQAASAS